MEHQRLSYKNSSISYYCFGTGPKKAVCFHGYGEEANAFAFLKHYAGEQYSFYVIDLPFHGKTVWNEGLEFSPADLQQIIQKIMQEQNSQSQTAKPAISLLGYSLGARMALSLFEIIPERIDRLILLAPDGLKVNGWYWLATQTWLGNHLFSFTMKNPGWFFGLLKILNKLRSVNASIFKFVNYYIGNETVRLQLYQRWMVLRKIKPDINHVKSLVKEYKVPTRLVYGRHDRIIRSATGEKFKKGIGDYCSLTVINSGHQVLQGKYVEEILAALQQ